MTTKNPKISLSKNEDKARDFFLSTNFSDENDNFSSDEGQLSCDVYTDENNIIVKSTLAGVEPKDLNISISNDLLTIRGYREDCAKIKDSNYLAREVYWGAFSRSIVLPQEIDQNHVKATLKKGILTVILPKKYKNTSIKVESIDD